MRIVRPQDLHNHIKGTFRVYQNETNPLLRCAILDRREKSTII
jgi:hypothetical protein